MNLLELVNEVLLSLDEVEVASVTSASGMAKRVIRWLNWAQFDVFMASNDWRWREKSNSLSTVAGTKVYTLASDVAIDNLKTVFFEEGDPLTYLPVEDFFASVDANSSTPHYYTIFENKIRLYPTPDGADTLYYHYLLTPTKMTVDASTTPIPEEYQYVLVEGALARAKTFLGDPDQQLQWEIYRNYVKGMLAQNKKYLGHSTGMQMEKGYMDGEDVS